MKRTFASTLAELRRTSGLSQRQVANDLKISQALLSHYENGAREPGLNFVCRVCDYYNVSADYLLCRSNNTRLEGASADAARSFLKQLKQLASEAEKKLEDAAAPASGVVVLPAPLGDEAEEDAVEV